MIDSLLVSAPLVRADIDALFHRLGLHRADERPILQSIREANAAWRAARIMRMERLATKVAAHDRQYGRRKITPPLLICMKGSRRAIWCVELKRMFRSISAAARFVRKKPSSISRALRTGGCCAGVHWKPCKVRKGKVK